MTGELLVVLVVIGVGLVGLVALVVATLRSVRRFTRASAALRTGLAAGVAPLRVPLWTPPTAPG